MTVSFQHATLDNGLTIIAETDPDAHSAAVGFFVRTGARDEDAKVMGVSHFLEHMMFKGTNTRSPEDINRGFDELGARNNAYTSSEITCFYAQIIPDKVPACLELLADMMRPALRQADFDVEKGVILEEIAMYKDQPFWVLYERLAEEHYAGHPLGHRVLGTDETITDLTRDQMQTYFEDRYSADNTILAAAGNLDFDALVSDASSLCGKWQRTGTTRNHGQPGATGKRLQLADDSVARGYLLAMAPGPAADDPRRYAATLAAQLLGGADNSRLHWALVETGLAEEAQAAFDPSDKAGLFYLFAAADPDSMDRVRDTMLAEAESLVDNVSDDDLARLRSRFATSMTIGGERPYDRMQRIGRQWAYLGEHTPLEEELDRINAVTLRDIAEVLNAFPIHASPTLGTLKPA